jgi:hypothetical protein
VTRLSDDVMACTDLRIRYERGSFAHCSLLVMHAASPVPLAGKKGLYGRILTFEQSDA